MLTGGTPRFDQARRDLRRLRTGLRRLGLDCLVLDLISRLSRLGLIIGLSTARRLKHTLRHGRGLRLLGVPRTLNSLGRICARTASSTS